MSLFSSACKGVLLIGNASNICVIIKYRRKLIYPVSTVVQWTNTHYIMFFTRGGYHLSKFN